MLIRDSRLMVAAALLLTAVAPGAERIAVPLAGDFLSTPANRPAVVAGPYRFVDIAGRRGYQPLSLSTSLQIPCAVQQGERGSFTLWVSPLETLTVSPPLEHVARKDPHWQRYALLSDGLPGNDPAKSVFAWYWQSQWHPQMIAKFKQGAAGNTAADFGVTPYVPVEHLPLRRGTWYQLVFTWDKPASRFRVYVNGILCATTSYPFHCDPAGDTLYLGNTAMAFAGFEAEAEEISAAEIARRYDADPTTKSVAVNDELRRLFTVQPAQPADWQPGPGWNFAYDRALTGSGDFTGWHQQGCMQEPFVLKERKITPEGLLLQTPDAVNTESRVYFWSPDVFEGDLAVEFEFRPEQTTGLALLVVQASGMQREDFLADHLPRTSGSMDTIIADRVRNYHWEYFRHAVDVRGDLATQVLVKNPWMRPLAMSSQAPLALNEWHRLLFVQEGNRLRGAIDGVWVFDMMDDPDTHSGPVLDRGRVALRLMYGTKMRFRNLKIWNRPGR
ncbi:hypothetical protein Verru16b_01386 [Lacunisphaera limnophila]|uniref:3-keto-disaccharide hydrolase domain-containing protein n=1 Tax=Lacunisphaera limnophila TaxID=1838286 RepID=A0A1D8ATV1_9BACT|nr:DUF1961 family protein [Lacunisphaera limnophila]AOS44325.1 hypothetical protein Verru16b_01386 [Lacunisphaera limnophila]